MAGGWAGTTEDGAAGRLCRESTLGKGTPGSAGILPATGRRPATVHAGKMPALPGTAVLRLGILSCHGVANPAMWALKDQYP